jgi:hypothetical protein
MANPFPAPLVFELMVEVPLSAELSLVTSLLEADVCPELRECGRVSSLSANIGVGASCESDSLSLVCLLHVSHTAFPSLYAQRIQAHIADASTELDDIGTIKFWQ